MTPSEDLQNSWFNALHERRKNALGVFKDPEYINVFNGVIDKYCDSAHFIYELLQNADDAKATEVEMVLTKNQFIFTHNGMERFTVSNPENAEEDRMHNRLGHINAITAIGFSSKNNVPTNDIDDIKIGKFGVGFKAVFQYTTTPSIYDKPFCFKIEDYIVPTKLNDTTLQREGKTVFVIPFDRKDIDAQQAYEDIEQKISSLDYPQLFLRNMQTISWNTPTQRGKIVKQLLEKYDTYRNITTALYELNSTRGSQNKILLLSRNVTVADTDNKHIISIGYFLNEKGRIDTECRPNINCFFPTHENIDTCYIIHAPFALVDNRQQIKRNNNVNDSLFKSIGELAADSLVVLKEISIKNKRPLLDDNIFALMHHNLESFEEKKNYYYWEQPEKKSFVDYYMKIVDNEPIFFSKQKKYITKSNGWWGDDGIRKLLSTEQLDYLTKSKKDNYVKIDNEEIKYDFILCSLNTRNAEDMKRYGIDIMSDSKFAEYLNIHFMNAQSEEWLTKLYKYILDNRLTEKYQKNAGLTSEAPMLNAPIIKNECNEFVSPYRGDKLYIFFKSENIVSPEFIINSNLYEKNEQFRSIIKQLGVTEPSIYDQIRIQLAKDLNKEELNHLLKTIIKYNNDCDEKAHHTLFLLLKDKLSLYCKTINDITEESIPCHIDQMIDDSSMLIEYYSCTSIKNKHYIDREFYRETIEAVGERTFNNFLNDFNFCTLPPVVSENAYLTEDELSLRPDKYYSNMKEVVTIEGLNDVLKNIVQSNRAKELSHYIWDSLIKILKKDLSTSEGKKLFSNDSGSYHYYKWHTQVWQSCTLREWLRQYKWLYIDGQLKSIEDGVYVDNLIPEMYTYNERLYSLLLIRNSPIIEEEESIKQMSETTQQKFLYGEIVKKYGVSSTEELEKTLLAGRSALQAKEEQKAKEEKHEKTSLQKDLPKRKKSEKFSNKDFSEDNTSSKIEKHKQTAPKSASLEDVLTGFEEKANLQREEIEQVMTLREIVDNSKKYSYGWLKALMTLEVQSTGIESASGKRSINILFDRIMSDTEHVNRIILTSASRNIPNMIEDIDGIPVTFFFRNGEKQTVVFDNASVKEDALIVRGNSSLEPIIKSIINNISIIYRASIDIEKPIELIKRWKSLIEELPFKSDEGSVKDNLRSDLKFIFGPPGTGKTTTLAKRIIGLMNHTKQCRILVLAPTNKACDVLAKKVLELEPENDYWLWRFVSTMDPELEDEEIVYQRNSDIMRQDQVCVVSTIARYSFDGFEDGMLNSINWDYVIIDEASMIPLYQILPPLFNEQSGKIWIAGDPFQIDPIVNIDLWKDENIYKMIELRNFANPQTSPVQFDVELLMTQYRSIPVIGELYSQYMYQGKLCHDRSAASHRVLNMGIQESPLNIISFPVNNDSIFETKRLMGSNIHIYSVLFTVEFLKYITGQLSKDCSNKPIRIGVLSPYGVEIQSIEKLYNQTCLPYSNITVDFGTSHGFQGDQCDIVIAVMNPPASGLKRNAELTFINKPNILNVAVSRAKDYLFILMPGKEYELFPMLHELKKLGKIMVSTRCNNFYTSDEIEKIIFGNIHYIEDNTYVTAHQTTNVYSDPLAKYEVRVDDQALDIQINR